MIIEDPFNVVYRTIGYFSAFEFIKNTILMVMVSSHVSRNLSEEELLPQI
jgi:hypothetical protein